MGCPCSRTKEHPESCQNVRPDVREVVRVHRIVEKPLDRRREDRDAEEMLRIRERVTVRKEVRRVPEASESVRDAVGIPPKHGGGEDRISHAAGNGLRGQKRQGYVATSAAATKIKNGNAVSRHPAPSGVEAGMISAPSAPRSSVRGSTTSLRLGPSVGSAAQLSGFEADRA